MNPIDEIKVRWNHKQSAVDSSKNQTNNFFFFFFALQSGNTWTLKSKFQVSSISGRFLGESLSRQSAFVFIWSLISKIWKSKKDCPMQWAELTVLFWWNFTFLYIFENPASRGRFEKKMVLNVVECWHFSRIACGQNGYSKTLENSKSPLLDSLWYITNRNNKTKRLLFNYFTPKIQKQQFWVFRGIQSRSGSEKVLNNALRFFLFFWYFLTP